MELCNSVADGFLNHLLESFQKNNNLDRTSHIKIEHFLKVTNEQLFYDILYMRPSWCWLFVWTMLWLLKIHTLSAAYLFSVTCWSTVCLVCAWIIWRSWFICIVQVIYIFPALLNWIQSHAQYVYRLDKPILI